MTDLIHKQSASITAASQADNKETFNLSKSSAFAALQTALKIFKEVAGKTQVPGLQEGVKALLVVLEVLQVRFCLYVEIHAITDPSNQKTSQNIDEVESFAKRIKALTESLEDIIANDAPLSNGMRGRIERLSQ